MAVHPFLLSFCKDRPPFAGAKNNAPVYRSWGRYARLGWRIDWQLLGGPWPSVFFPLAESRFGQFPPGGGAEIPPLRQGLAVRPRPARLTGFHAVLRGGKPFNASRLSAQAKTTGIEV